MAQYPEYKDLKYAELEQKILKFWKENKIFEASINSREGKPSFTFYEGPPSANGMPGIHHVMARSIKDIFCRFNTLKGYQVKRKAGWDTHGLPIELSVEKELGITKEDIGTKISVEEYNQKCREAVMRYTDVWEDLTEQMGYWVDMQNPYVTYHNDYIESVWNLLKKLHDKNLLYKGYTIQPYSPKAGSGLSAHELNMPGTYRDVKDTSITAQFKVKANEKSDFLFAQKDDRFEEIFILAWTTTPWTLPSNTGLAVGKGIRYVQIKTYNPYTYAPIQVVLAKDLVGKYFNPKNEDLDLEAYNTGNKKIPYKIVAEFAGSELAGVQYEQLFPYVKPDGKAFEVVVGDFVTTEDGTGIVHTAPTFGADDFRVAQQNDVAAALIKDENGQDAPLVDKQGRFVAEVTDFAGKYVKAEYEDAQTLADPNYKSTDVLIAIKLKGDNRAFKVEKYEHSYPHCWRTDKPILYYPLDSWFIRTTAMKDKLVELNKTINWKPKSTGEGRFGNWLENLVDWNLSRQRYWGIPLPIWRSEDKQEELCIGSIGDLVEAIKQAQSQLSDEEAKADNATFLKAYEAGEQDLHRPYVDNIVLVSDKGTPLYREADLIDVWFDSGSMPYAQHHYPFENKETFEGSFPADFISEGVDQTRGWFFTLHAIAGMLFDSVAFKNVVSTGLVLDKHGKKMSKRLGNAVDPFETMGKYGADATRWYMISNANPWDNLKFNTDGIEEVSRRFFGTLKNTYAFFALYANLDKFRFSEDKVTIEQHTESDRWIISKLNSLIKVVDAAYQDYEPTKVANLIQDFTIDDLSNWYVRLNRKRFWKSDYGTDKIAAYQTLYTCLETIAVLASPIMPFYTERIYQDLNGVSQKHNANSVHLLDFPKADETLIDLELEQKMDLAQRISSLTHSLRKNAAVPVRVRQPLSKILLPLTDEQLKHKIQAVEALILSEVNVKAIEFIQDDSGIVKKSAKPNFKVLKEKYAANIKTLIPVIKQLTQAEIQQIEREGNLQKGDFSLTHEDILITSEDVEGLSVAVDKELTVALDLHIDDALRQEGIARDVINRIQNMRKDQNLEVQDKITIVFAENEPFVTDAFSTFEDYIKTETQATSLNVVKSLTETQSNSFEVDGFQLVVKIDLVK